MTALVLLILGAVWAAVLVPPALRARAEAHPGDTIGSFHHQLNVLRRTGGYQQLPVQGEFGQIPVTRPTRRRVVHYDAAKKRRRDVLVTLLWIMGTSLVLGLLPAFRALLWLHVVADMLFVAYVVLLLRVRRLAAEQQVKVTRLPSHARAGVADLALRRAAND